MHIAEPAEPDKIGISASVLADCRRAHPADVARRLREHIGQWTVERDTTITRARQYQTVADTLFMQAELIGRLIDRLERDASSYEFCARRQA